MIMELEAASLVPWVGPLHERTHVVPAPGRSAISKTTAVPSGLSEQSACHHMAPRDVLLLQAHSLL